MSTDQADFRDRFRTLFDAHFHRVFRYLDRLTGDPELAADVAQETFVKLYQRGAAPDSPEAWIITVALNLLRNARTTSARRRRLMTPARAQWSHGDPAPAPERVLGAERVRARVRAALDELPERERTLLLLRVEGYSYRAIAEALALHEASVGTLMARARQKFRESYERLDDGT